MELISAAVIVSVAFSYLAVVASGRFHGLSTRKGHCRGSRNRHEDSDQFRASYFAPLVWAMIARTLTPNGLIVRSPAA